MFGSETCGQIYASDVLMVGNCFTDSTGSGVLVPSRLHAAERELPAVSIIEVSWNSHVALC